MRRLALRVRTALRPVFGLNFLRKQKYLSMYIDVLLELRVIVLAARLRIARAMPPCSRHEPIGGADEFLSSPRDFAAQRAIHSVEKAAGSVAL
ncbi:MAG: hypothetical protein KBG15_23900 [Kofleriaceae bacterium]|nr:hypothetical protein [Kofleriaceae bacterium]